jgi:hypothetical protein
MQFFGHEQAEHAVAEKFKALIGARGICAGMGERALQQIAIGEMMAEALFEISR